MDENILELQNLSAWYSQEKNVLDLFSLQLRPHEVVGLIGLNGAGKTTFLKTLSGLHGGFRCDSIRLHSRPVSFRDKDFGLASLGSRLSARSCGGSRLQLGRRWTVPTGDQRRVPPAHTAPLSKGGLRARTTNGACGTPNIAGHSSHLPYRFNRQYLVKLRDFCCGNPGSMIAYQRIHAEHRWEGEREQQPRNRYSP